MTVTAMAMVVARRDAVAAVATVVRAVEMVTVVVVVGDWWHPAVVVSVTLVGDVSHADDG